MRIAFVRGRERTGIYVMRSDGRAQGRVVSDGYAPAWSPDARHLAYLRSGQIRIVSLETGEDRVVAAGSFQGRVAWSPDGRQLAFSGEGADGCGPRSLPSRLQIVNVDGSGRTTLTASCSDDLDPDWQPICTHYGSDRGDVLIGTEGADVICSLRGDDRIAALGGDDVIIGGDGADTIYGGEGADRLFGSAGTDKVFGNGDTAASRDIVNGGPGRDVGVVDAEADVPWELEQVVRR